MPIKFPFYGEVVVFLVGGGGSANSIFMGVGIFPKSGILCGETDC